MKRCAEGGLKTGQAESVVDTLAQNPAQMRFPLQDQNVPDSLLVKPDRGRQPRRAASHDDNIYIFLANLHHSTSSRTLPKNIWEPVLA